MVLEIEVAIVPAAGCTYPELVFQRHSQISFSAKEREARWSGSFTLKRALKVGGAQQPRSYRVRVGSDTAL